MDVKQPKPRLGRRPSPRLWEMVRSYTDDEWRQFKAFSDVYGKGSQQWRLLEFHRNQERYIPELEKETFADVALTSMRNTARNWLVRTSIRLGLLAVELEDLTREVDDLLRRGFPDVAWEHHTEAKRLATEQEEFDWLARLLKQELVLAKLLLTGEEREAAMLRVSEEAIANAKLLVLDAEIAAMEVRYLETPRARLADVGTLKGDPVEAYFESEFYLQNLTTWPVTFQARKLKIDEINFYLLGRVLDSLGAASRIKLLLSANSTVRQSMARDLGKTLFRMFFYNYELKDIQGGRMALQSMRECNPTIPSNRNAYLSRYIYMLFHAGFIWHELELAEEAARLFEDHKAFFDGRSNVEVQVEILMCITAYHLITGQLDSAKKTVARLVSIGDTTMPIPYIAIYKIQHLITLLEDADLRGMESYGTNYKRHLRRHLPATGLAIQVITILSRPSNLDSKPRFRAMLEELLELLLPYEKSDEFTFKPFIYPIILWAQRHLDA